MTKKSYIYVVVLVAFVVACGAVYLFLTGSTGAAVVTGAAAVAITGAASRGRAQEATESAIVDIEVTLTDSVKVAETLEEAEEAISDVQDDMNAVELDGLSAEDKLAELARLHEKEQDHG